VHEWRVAGAIVEGPDGLLLVKNRRRGGWHDWTPPGGVVDAGESVLGALGREVREETGLEVVEWSGPAYRVTAEAPDLGWRLQVEVFRAKSWSGALRVGDDPDGIVVEARFAPAEQCRELLTTTFRWVAEPVGAWLDEPWDDDRHFAYRVTGTSLRELVVERA
jgi:8-oxo-dGTP diphosphatase